MTAGWGHRRRWNERAGGAIGSAEAVAAGGATTPAIEDGAFNARGSARTG